MKSLLKYSVFAFLLGMGITFSCKEEYLDLNHIKPPIANAGPDQTIDLPIDSVVIDGNSSSDPDGTIIKFKWTKISGPSMLSIVNAFVSTTVIKNLQAGTYQVELKVTDNSGLTGKDTMKIMVNNPLQANRPPMADAGPDQKLELPISQAILNGNGSSDPDSNIISYNWLKISGPSSFNIENESTTQTAVTNLVEGIYIFELKVTDAGLLFSKDTMQIYVNPAPKVLCPTNRPIIQARLVPFATLSGSKGPVAVAAAGNKIVFAGGWGEGNKIGGDGSSSVDIYDIVTHDWSKAELSVARWDMVVAVSGNKIFFAGGNDTDGSTFGISYANVDIYDVVKDSWTVSSLSVARHGIAGGAVGNKVFFAGGIQSTMTIPSNIIDIYDLQTSSWSVATLKEARWVISATTVGDKIYFAGGQNSARNNSEIVEIYDNTTGTWSVSTLIAPKARMASVSFANKIYWAGGTNNMVEIFNSSSNTSSIACLFQANSEFSAVANDNKIIFFTGNGEAKNKFDIYDVTADIWSIGYLDHTVANAAIISVNNTIYVAGGNVDNTIFNQVWKLEF